MGSIGKIKKVLRSQLTIEGAGVHLKRAFDEYENGTFIEHKKR